MENNGNVLEARVTAEPKLGLVKPIVSKKRDLAQQIYENYNKDLQQPLTLQDFQRKSNK